MPIDTFPDWTEPTVIVVVVVFTLTAYDNLRNYYRRADRLLGTLESEPPMSNGGHPKKDEKSKKPVATGEGRSSAKSNASPSKPVKRPDKSGE